jgi:hypothetical protein
MNLTTILRAAKAVLSLSSISQATSTPQVSRKSRAFTSTLLVLSFVFSLLRVESGWGQVSVCATPTNNNGNGKVTFNFQNSNSYAVIIKDISSICSSSISTQTQVWYRTSALAHSTAAGFPAVNTTNWTLASTQTITGVANSSTTTPQSFFNNSLSITVPAGATYGFCINAASSSSLTTGNLRYSSLTAGVSYTYSGGGCNILSGGPTATNASAAGSPVGSSTAFSFVPRGFIGCVSFIASVPCSGIPNAGTALISSASGCANANVNLSSSGLSAATGITYQWQSSIDNGVTWNNILGATNNTATVTPGVTTMYRIRTTCSNSASSNNSSTITYTVNVSGACLCGAYPSIYASSTADEEISNVTVGSMNNTSNCTTAATGAGSVLNRYANYSGVVTGPSAMQGSSVNFSLTQTSCGGAYGNIFQLYVDWNQDGDWLDAGEQVYNQSASVNGGQTATGSFTVPAGATVGTTRMRVVNIEIAPTATN